MPPFRLGIVVDFVCPWCFIGKRRLETAVALVRRDFPGFTVDTFWAPFFLNPDTPPEGEPYLPFLEQKFGSRTAVEALFERVREAGRAYGLDYAFEKIALRANTLCAHRLVRFAQQSGPVDQLVERLFVAQFQRGEAIGDLSTLARIASEAGLDGDQVQAFLNSDALLAEVLDDEQQVRRAGIRQVPTFLLPHGQVIVGAEDPRVLAEAIKAQLTGLAS